MICKIPLIPFYEPVLLGCTVGVTPVLQGKKDSFPINDDDAHECRHCILWTEIHETVKALKAREDNPMTAFRGTVKSFLSHSLVVCTC